MKHCFECNALSYNSQLKYKLKHIPTLIERLFSFAVMAINLLSKEYSCESSVDDGLLHVQGSVELSLSMHASVVRNLLHRFTPATGSPSDEEKCVFRHD